MDNDKYRDFNSENQSQNFEDFTDNESALISIGEVRNVYSNRRKESVNVIRQPSSSKVTFSFYVTFYI